MSTWFHETPESLRLLAEERAIVEAAELVSEAIAARGVTRKSLAQMLGIARSEVTQRLNGTRNLTIRSLAGMLHELGYDLQIRLRDRRAGRAVWCASGQVDTGVRYATNNEQIRLVSAHASAS